MANELAGLRNLTHHKMGLPDRDRGGHDRRHLRLRPREHLRGAAVHHEGLRPLDEADGVGRDDRRRRLDRSARSPASRLAERDRAQADDGPRRAHLRACSRSSAALATSLVFLDAARFFLGVTIGISIVTAPIFVAESAPAAVRGGMIVMYQVATVTGIVIAYFVDYALAGAEAWRWMLGALGGPVAARAAPCSRGCPTRRAGT